MCFRHDEREREREVVVVARRRRSTITQKEKAALPQDQVGGGVQGNVVVRKDVFFSFCERRDPTHSHTRTRRSFLLLQTIIAQRQNPPTFQGPFSKVFTGVLALGIPVAGVGIITGAVNFQNKKHGFDKNPVHN